MGEEKERGEPQTATKADRSESAEVELKPIVAEISAKLKATGGLKR